MANYNKILQLSVQQCLCFCLFLNILNLVNREQPKSNQSLHIYTVIMNKSHDLIPYADVFPVETGSQNDDVLDSAFEVHYTPWNELQDFHRHPHLSTLNKDRILHDKMLCIWELCCTFESTNSHVIADRATGSSPGGIWRIWRLLMTFSDEKALMQGCPNFFSKEVRLYLIKISESWSLSLSHVHTHDCQLAQIRPFLSYSTKR